MDNEIFYHVYVFIKGENKNLSVSNSYKGNKEEQMEKCLAFIKIVANRQYEKDSSPIGIGNEKEETICTFNPLEIAYCGLNAGAPK